MDIKQIETACRLITSKYAGKSIEELRSLLEIDNPLYDKGIAISVSNSLFALNGYSDLLKNNQIILRTIQLYKNGTKKFDMKLFEVNFDEIKNNSLSFKESNFFKYFHNTIFVFAIFEIPNRDNERLRNNIFKGFKLISFDNHFIDNEVKLTWNVIRDLVNNNKLVDVVQKDRSGTPILNSSGTVQSAPNFPKSKDYIVFLRGGGRDSSDKRLTLNGIAMLKQYVWVRGDYIAKELSNQSFL